MTVMHDHPVWLSGPKRTTTPPGFFARRMSRRASGLQLQLIRRVDEEAVEGAHRGIVFLACAG